MNLTQEEINMVLEAGLEKVAYEEGLNDYADSLEKVAGVHGVDAMELHDFLEKAAEEQENGGMSKKQLAALIGGGAGAAGAGVAGKGVYDFVKNAPESVGTKAALKEALKNPGNMAARGGRSVARGAKNVAGFTGDAAKAGAGALGSAGSSALQALKNNKGKAGLGAAGLAGLGAAGAYANKKRKEKQKTAAAYGLDEETFDALFEAGIDALTE
jgi:hypothetical protein